MSSTFTFSFRTLPNNTLLSNKPPQTININKQPCSNLFFQLSSYNSQPSKFNHIQTEYLRYITRYHNNPYRHLKTLSKSPKYGNRHRNVMNDLYYVYNKVKTVNKGINTDFTCYTNKLNNIPRYREKVYADGSNFFPTQINKVNHYDKAYIDSNITNPTTTNNNEHSREEKEDDNDDNDNDDQLYGRGYVIPRFPQKKYIVLKQKRTPKIEIKPQLYAKDVYLELEKGINNDGTKNIQKDYDLFLLGNEIHETRRPPIKFK